jgi:IS30 family transposase
MLYPITDFNELTEGDVSNITRLLNERPRKTLDFQTPKEAFSNLY